MTSFGFIGKGVGAKVLNSILTKRVNLSKNWGTGNADTQITYILPLILLIIMIEIIGI